MPLPTWLLALSTRHRRLHPTLLALLTFLIASMLACSGTTDEPRGSAGSSAAGVTSGGAGSPSGAGGATASGFGGSSTPGANGGGAGGLNSGGSASGGSAAGSSAIEASFNTFKSIIPTSCFGGLCHDLPENPLHLTVNDGLYARLTTHVTKNCGPVIKPGSPQDSALVKLLKGPCGETDRMPFGKCFEDGDEGCITPEYIAAIEKWIANGAPP
jgi:hypothetical protein